MRRLPLLALVATLSAGPVFAQSAPTYEALSPAHKQLSKSLRLTDAQAERLTLHQLALLKQIQESPTLSEGDKRRRSKAILNGVVPRFQLTF